MLDLQRRICQCRTGKQLLVLRIKRNTKLQCAQYFVLLQVVHIITPKVKQRSKIIAIMYKFREINSF